VDEGAEVVAVWCHQPGSKLLLVATAATDVRGFVALADDLVATTKKGKTALVCDQGFKAALVSVVVGDHVAIVGENRRLLVFPLADIAEMSRGKGSRLQKYKDGTMSDIKMFALDEGLTWRSADGRTFSVTKQELTDWIGHRGDVGRLPPKGFPKNNRFVG
jgi:topoisomerase-4 subunit A